MQRIVRSGLRRLRIPKTKAQLIKQHIDETTTSVPFIKDTGVHVLTVLVYLIEHDWSTKRTQNKFRDLSPAQIRAVIAYAETAAGKELLKQKKRNCPSK